MALKVRSATGRTYHRCGMEFGREPVIVPEAKLAEKFGTPVVTKKSKTIGEILRADTGLYCDEAAESPADATASDSATETAGRRRNKQD